MHLHVVPQVGLGREALVTLRAGERLLLGVDAAMTDELGGDTEGLATVRALVAFGLSVDPSVVLERHEVGELLLAGAAEVGPCLVAVLVVEQGAGMSVRPATLVTHVGLDDLTVAPTAAGCGHAIRVESLLLH